MYYSIYDLQTHDYLHSGRNSDTLEEALEDWISYFTGGGDMEEKYENLLNRLAEEKKWTEIVTELNCYGFEIEEHENKIPEKTF